MPNKEEVEEVKKLIVPDGWHEITIEQFQDINFLDMEGNKTIDILSILLNEDPELVRILDMPTLTKVTELLNWSNELPNDAVYKPILRFNGEEYGLVSRMHSLTVGEWIDLDYYLQDGSIKNLHIIMSILYRPLITALNDRDRVIEEYDHDKAIQQSIKFQTNVMIGDVYGCLVFFYLIANECTKIIQDYLAEEQLKIQKMMNSETKQKRINWNVFDWKKKKTTP